MPVVTPMSVYSQKTDQMVKARFIIKMEIIIKDSFPMD